MKVKNKCSYPEARRVVTSHTPQSGVSYASLAAKVTRSFGTQTDSAKTDNLPLQKLAPKDKKKKRKTNIKPILAEDAPLAKS